MKQHKEKGIAHLGIIIAVVIAVAAVAFGGWYVWQKNKANNNTNASQTTNNTQNSQNEEPADPSEGGKYLVIREWGVRFLLPEELRGDLLLYISNGDASGTTIFASKRLNNLTGDSSCDLVEQPGGGYSGGVQSSLNRINPKTYKTASLEYYRSQLDYIKTVGEYQYYNYKSTKNPPITCLTNQHEEFNDIEQSISDQLKEAFKTIEPVEVP